MFKNYLTVAIRNLLRNKLYSVINIFGLAIGLACCLLILLFLQDELRFDQFHKKVDRVYAVFREQRTPGSTPGASPATSGPLGAALAKDFPEVEHAVRMIGPAEGVWVAHKDKGFTQRVCATEQSFFDVFDFSVMPKNAHLILQKPYTILITQKSAQLFFGHVDPIGKIVKVGTRNYGGEYQIVGVMDVPDHSSLQFNFLTTTVVATSQSQAPEMWTNWQWRSFLTYIVLAEGADPEILENKLPTFIERYLGEEARKYSTYYLHSFARQYLYVQPAENQKPFGVKIVYGDIRQVYIFSAVAFFILLIACINFMNLATARSVGRTREVGIRKVVGAHRLQLIYQFIGESTLLVLFAMILGLGLLALLLPAFSAFAAKDLSFWRFMEGSIWAGLLGSVVVLGGISGSYPAFFLSAFQPVQVLKGRLGKDLNGHRFRQGQIVMQFAISTLLIIGTIVVYAQVTYMQNKKLGFDASHLITMPLFRVDRHAKPMDDWLVWRYQTVKQAFTEHPNVLKASGYRFPVGEYGGNQHGVRPEGATGNEWRMHVQEVDESFLDTFEIPLVAGRNFRSDLDDEPTHPYILNETAVKQLGWTDPVGKSFEWVLENGTIEGTVVGVVKDYHFGPVRDRIAPQVITANIFALWNLTVRVRSENLEETLAFLEQTWTRFAPDRPFEYTFVDERLSMLYKKEQHLGEVLGLFALLAIMLACLGLFGLVSFTAEQRTREIGIRKVLGASISSVVSLLSGGLLKLILIAVIIAWPLTYVMLDRWLQDFPYRIDLGFGTFVLGGTLTIVIALMTVGFQAWKASRANPIEALRHE